MVELLAILVLIGLAVALREYIAAGLMLIAGLAVILIVGLGVVLGGIYLYDATLGSRAEVDAVAQRETDTVCDVLTSEEVRNLCYSGDEPARRTAQALDMLAACRWAWGRNGVATWPRADENEAERRRIENFSLCSDQAAAGGGEIVSYALDWRERAGQ